MLLCRLSCSSNAQALWSPPHIPSSSPVVIRDSVELVMTNEPTSRRDKESYNKMNKNSFSNMRCSHCTGPLSKEMETSEWTVPPLIRDSFSMIGSAVGGTTSAFYGFNHVMPLVRRWVKGPVMPLVRRWVKGPMWLHFLVGAPPVIVFSSACAGLVGGAVPAFAQLASSSYHAAISSSTLPPTASQDENMRKSRTSSTL